MSVRQRLISIRSDSGFKTDYGDVIATGNDPKERTVSIWINGHEATLIPEEVALLQVALREELDFATGNRS